jgi:beta-lactamase superfamily II metal-dependent hydrolase
MYTVDFLAVENDDSTSSKSGDAIVMEFTHSGTGEHPVVVIDAGYTAIGEKLVEHIKDYFPETIDLVIATHPDNDHLNGLKTIVETLPVKELMMHLPWLHRTDLAGFGNYEAVVDLYNAAVERDILVTEPFAGEERFGGALKILGPTSAYYEEMLDEHLAEASSGAAAARLSHSSSSLLASATRLLSKALAFFPFETLNDTDDTGPRNKMSVVTYVDADGHRMLFTGDAGIKSLEMAADLYEARVGSFAAVPLAMFQAPHHGSKHNLGPAVLDRILGSAAAPHGSPSALISSAKSSDKHPSPKVSNALGRRGARVFATEGSTISHSDQSRFGWSSKEALSPLDEDDE